MDWLPPIDRKTRSRPQKYKRGGPASSLDLRLHPLRDGLLRFVFPLANPVLMDPAQLQKLFFIVNHLLAAAPGEGIILHQKNRLFRTNLLAKTAEDASQHVDFKFSRRLFHIPNLR